MGIENVRLMNRAAAAFFAVTGIVLFVVGLGKQPSQILVYIAAGYTLLVAIPLLSAHGLSADGSKGFRIFAIIVNALCIGLWSVSLVRALYNHYGIVRHVGSVIWLVIPQAINIWTLIKLNRPVPPGFQRFEY